MSQSTLPERFSRKIPSGDNREREVCETCNYIAYQNPKIVSGAVVSFEGKILLCKRSIAPRSGYWTIPAGYIELGETPLQGASREAQEEALATIEADQMLGIYSVPHLSQVQILYRATLKDGVFGVGEESSDARLYDWDKIPWDELAFPSVIWALKCWKQVEGQMSFPPFESQYILPPNQTSGLDI